MFRPYKYEQTDYKCVILMQASYDIPLPSISWQVSPKRWYVSTEKAEHKIVIFV